MERMKWNKLTLKKVTTNKEKEEYAGFDFYWDGTAPELDEEVMISDGKRVWTDTWIDYGTGVGFSNYDEEVDIPIYWMSFPEPPKEDID